MLAIPKMNGDLSCFTSKSHSETQRFIFGTTQESNMSELERCVGWFLFSPSNATCFQMQCVCSCLHLWKICCANVSGACQFDAFQTWWQCKASDCKCKQEHFRPITISGLWLATLFFRHEPFWTCMGQICKKSKSPCRPKPGRFGVCTHCRTGWCTWTIFSYHMTQYVTMVLGICWQRLRSY